MTNSFVNSSRNALLSWPCRIVPDQHHQWTSRFFLPHDILRIYVPVERTSLLGLCMFYWTSSGRIPCLLSRTNEFLLLYTFSFLSFYCGDSPNYTKWARYHGKSDKRVALRWWRFWLCRYGRVIWWWLLLNNHWRGNYMKLVCYSTVSLSRTRLLFTW